MQSANNEQCGGLLRNHGAGNGNPLAITLRDERPEQLRELSKLLAVDNSEGGQVPGEPSTDDTLQLCKARARLGMSERVLKETQAAHRLFTG